MKIHFSNSLRGEVDLYVKGKKFPPASDPFGKALSQKIGLPGILTSNNYTKSFNLPDIVSSFFSIYGTVYMVPIDDYTGNLYGFLYRAVTKKSFRVTSSHPGIFYGFHDFEGFKYGQPLVLVEGIKDAEAVKRAGYLYTLAILSSTVNKTQQAILNGLTKNVIIVSDNDFFGKLHSCRLASKNLGYQVFVPPEKDVGIIFDKESPKTELFLKSLVRILKV